MPNLKISASLLGVLMPLLSVLPAQAQPVFSARKDWSSAANPGAYWGYYANGTVLGTFSDPVRGVNGVSGWTDGTPEPTDAIIAKTGYRGGGVIHSNNVAYFVVYLTMDPEKTANVSVRFTASKSGNYHIKGKFVSLDNFEQLHTVEVRHNGAAFLTYTIDAHNFQAPIRTLVRLAAGDTLDFVCDTAGDGTHLSTGIAATLTRH